ncbi:hypothetical protein MMC07_007354 [Pseudocyphellaria aurata]|nr:hypothetical protein [Pseudocyphellaria aurata]
MPLLAGFDVQNRPGRTPTRPSDRDRSGYEQAKPYPTEELEWLATTAFNKAVDFYCASQTVECRRWAEKALSIAELIIDGEALHELLQTKFMGLTWDRSET